MDLVIFQIIRTEKSFFIDGHKPYEDELVRLALNESLTKKKYDFIGGENFVQKSTSAKLIKNSEKSMSAL